MLNDEAALTEKTAAAMRALARTVDDAPPLHLSPHAEPSPLRRAPRRHWRLWAVPATAAAAVVALALALAALRGTPTGPVATPSPPVARASGSVPPYYVTLQGPPPWTGLSAPQAGPTPQTATRLIAGETLTGKRLDVIKPPAGMMFMNVTGAADDRTFVVSLARDHRTWGPGPAAFAGMTLPRTWYLLRLSPGSTPGYRMTRLPIPPTRAGTTVLGFALSPDGSELAVLEQPSASGNATALTRLRLYSAGTGDLLRTWTATGSNSAYSADANTMMAWADGTRLLAYDVIGPSERIMLLDTSLPGDSLPADSRLAMTISLGTLASSCRSQETGNIRVSGDGKSLVCGVSGGNRAPAPRSGMCTTGSARNEVGFARYSLATGTRTGAIALYPTRCYGFPVAARPLWVNRTGDVVIGYLNLGEASPHAASTTAGTEFGIFRDGTFKRLPLPAGLSDVTGGTYVIAW